MKHLLTTAICSLALASGPAFSQQILTRTDLNNLLAGGTSYTDGFEANVGLSAGNAELTNLTVLDSASTFIDQNSNTWGPNLVGPGASYSGSNIQWNGDQYFGLNTQTILSDSQTLTVDYASPVQAMGIDLMEFTGYTDTYTFNVYNGADLVGSLTGSLAGSTSIFAGWQNDAGITSVVITGTNNTWSPVIDNSEYGTQAVPEPSSLAALAIGGLALLFKKRSRA